MTKTYIHARTDWRCACLLLALSSSTGCTLVYGDDVDRRQCKSQPDCDLAAAALATPLVCRAETCQAPVCTVSSECPTNSICVANLCVAGTEDGGAPPPVACTLDSDCSSAEKRCGFDGFCYDKWGCLGEELKWPATPFNVTYVTKLIRADDPGNPAAVLGTEVVACGIVDPTCRTPAVRADQVTIGADGTASVPLVNGASSNFFVGVVRFRTQPPAGETESPTIPAYRHFTTETPLVSDMADPITISLIPPAYLSALSQAYGLMLDPTAGTAQVFVADCGGRPAPGVSVAAPEVPAALFLTITSGGPVLGSNVTTDEGTGTVLNLPGGLQKLVVRDELLQVTITSTFTLPVQAAARNYVVYYPRNSALQKWVAEVMRRNAAQ